LPWDSGARDKKGNKPKVLSDMEQFLYDINVDIKASNGYNDNDDESDEEWNEIWTPPEGMRKKKRRRRFRGGARQRSEILSSCNIVLATLSGAGSKAFIDAVCRSENKTNSEFRAVIIDEACQSSESESLIPFKFNPTTVTLVGDPQQLPVLTLSSSHHNIYERSLFERLQKLNWPTILLREQYRMHESIAMFPSQEFYQGQLVTSINVKNRAPAWQPNPCFNTLAFWDSNGSKLSKRGNGYANKEEVDFIIRVLLSTFAKEYLVRSDINLTVGIISFYKDQVKMLQDGVASVPALRNNSRLHVKVATVDGFQGSECDIIILSCVRSHTEGELCL
jgi:superfamily I DNA and/or RNA helicase